MIDLDAALSRHFLGDGDETAAFDRIMSLDGEVFRHHKNRRTVRVELDGKGYFVKTHGPTGWREILKNVLRLRIPVLTAMPEVRAIERLERLGVRTPHAAGHGLRGRDPARLESFLVTEAIDGAGDLRQLAPMLNALPPLLLAQLRRRLIDQMAEVARTMHDNGLNHRDFYLTHFLVAEHDWRAWTPADPLELHLIDLHRMQQRRRTPERMIVRDLSGLLFAGLEVGLDGRDHLRFLRRYWGDGWRDLYRRRRRLRRRIVRRAVTIYRSDHGRPPQLPPGVASCA